MIIGSIGQGIEVDIMDFPWNSHFDRLVMDLVIYLVVAVWMTRHGNGTH